jgi:hypothetical protein
MQQHDWEKMELFSDVLGHGWECLACRSRIMSWAVPKPGGSEMQFCDRRGKWKRAPVLSDCSLVLLSQIRKTMFE